MMTEAVTIEYFNFPLYCVRYNTMDADLPSEHLRGQSNKVYSPVGKLPAINGNIISVFYGNENVNKILYDIDEDIERGIFEVLNDKEDFIYTLCNRAIDNHLTKCKSKKSWFKSNYEYEPSDVDSFRVYSNGKGLIFVTVPQSLMNNPMGCWKPKGEKKEFIEVTFIFKL